MTDGVGVTIGRVGRGVGDGNVGVGEGTAVGEGSGRGVGLGVGTGGTHVCDTAPEATDKNTMSHPNLTAC